MTEVDNQWRGVLTYCSKARTMFLKLDVTSVTVVLRAIFAVTIEI